MEVQCEATKATREGQRTGPRETATEKSEVVEPLAEGGVYRGECSSKSVAA